MSRVSEGQNYIFTKKTMGFEFKALSISLISVHFKITVSFRVKNSVGNYQF